MTTGGHLVQLSTRNRGNLKVSTTYSGPSTKIHQPFWANSSSA